MYGYEAVKKAIGDQADIILAQTSQEAKNLFNEIKSPQVDVIAQRIALQYKETKQITNNFLIGLANEINPPSTLDSTKQGTIQVANTPSQSGQIDTQVTQSTSVESAPIMTPEIMADPNFAIISRDEAKSKIDNSSSDVSEGLEGEVKLSVLNIQSSLYRMAYNTIGKSVAPLSEQEYYNLSSAATLSFLQLVSSKSKAEGGTAKLSSGAGVFGGVEKMTKEFNNSSLGSLFDIATNGSRMIKGGEKLLGEYEDLIESIITLRNNPRSTALQHPTSAQQLIGASIQKLPVNERINKITVAGSVNGSIQSVLSTLKLEPKSLGMLATVFEKMGGGDMEAVQKMEKLTSGIDDLTNQGLDKLVGSELAPLLGSFKLDGNFMKMIAKFFENSWVRGFMMSMGIDTKQLLKQLSGELDASQKLKWEVAMNKYTELAIDPTSTSLVQILGLTDPEDGIYKSLLGFSVEGLQQGLIDSKSQPHPSVLLYLTEDNISLRNKYFAIQSDQSYARNTTTISSEDLAVCTQGFVANEMMMSAPQTKSEFLDISFKTHADYASALVGYWLKGNMGMKGVSQLSLNKPEEAVAQTEPQPQVSGGTEVAERSPEGAKDGFVHIGKKYNAPGFSQEILSKGFKALDAESFSTVFHEFFDRGSSPEIVNQVIAYMKQQSPHNYIIPGMVEIFIGLAENAEGYDDPSIPNNDPNIKSKQKNYGAFQISTTGDPVELAKTHFEEGKKLMNITGGVEMNSRIGQLIGHLGGHIVSKNATQDLFSITSQTSAETMQDIIRDKIQIGAKNSTFKTDKHVYVMLNSKVSDMFTSQPDVVASSSKSPKQSNQG